MTLNRIVVSLAFVCGLISACAPYQQPQTPPAPAGAPGTQPTVTSPEQKALANARENAGTETGTAGTSEAPPAPPTDPTKKDFPQGIKIPGKDGFVFNPYNNNPVDVRGIPPGTLVRDPQDPDPDHKFRVP